MRYQTSNKTLFVFFLACIMGFDLYGQNNKPPGDTAANRSINEQIERSIKIYNQGKIAAKRDVLLMDLRKVGNDIRLILKKGFDSTSVKTHLVSSNEILTFIKSGASADYTNETIRNLNVNEIILKELLKETVDIKNSLSKAVFSIKDRTSLLDSIYTDSSLYLLPHESANPELYLEQTNLLRKEIDPINRLSRQHAENLNRLISEVDLLLYELNLESEENDRKSGLILNNIFTSENDSFQSVRNSVNLKKTFEYSFKKERIALSLYLADHTSIIIIFFLSYLVVYLFYKSLLSKIRLSGSKATDRIYLESKNPIFTSGLIVISIVQFLFLDPPFVFSFILWIIQTILLGFILHRYITPYWMKFWITTVMLFFLAGLGNLLLNFSFFERIAMLILSLFGIVYGITLLKSRKRSEIKEKKIIFFIYFMVIVQVLSVLANIAGLLNLSKSLFILGYSGTVIAIIFLWTVKLINDSLKIISDLFTHADRKLLYLDFNKIGDRVPSFFYLLVVIGWVILLGRTFYGLKKVSSSVREILDTERSIGEYTFNINGIFFFLITLIISFALSQAISFFTDDSVPHVDNSNDSPRRAGPGSYLLLIRIFIISVGVFLAFAAAGIPIDRLTIVLGALGVGIGLGLQSLVSNLVSGLIIAFEKPVNVGEIIEINGKLGTMNSIGFRSSIVNMIDGPSLIIPNSDILNNHLVNWTMGKNRRRLNVTASVAYSSDLKKVKEILMEVLTSNESIMKDPAPIISAKEFSDSSIDLEVYFWIEHIRSTLPMRSEVIISIHEAFRREGIQIPFPQRDLHFK